MGLDMYLYLQKHDSIMKFDSDYSVDFYPPELKHLQADIWERNFLSKNTMYQVGYWRKFNALHNWVVKNCANGEDNCKPIYLDIEDIDKILDIVKKVQENHDLAKDLLPTKEGFFFGGVDYDKWYFLDIDYTYNLLTKVKKVLVDNPKYDLYYEASW